MKEKFINPEVPVPQGEKMEKENKVSQEDERLIKQLYNPERRQFGNDELTIYEASPRAKNLKSEVPVVFGAGFMQDGEKQRELMFQLAKRGRRSLSFTAPHGIEEHGLNPERTEGFPEAEVRKMAALLATIDEKGIEKTDYVGHSEGGVYGLMAAAAYPKKFRSVFLDSPIVIKKGDTPLKLVKRFSADLATGIAQDMKKDKPSWVEKTGQKPGLAGDVYDSPWSRSVQKMYRETGSDRQPSEHKQSLSPKKLWQEIKAIANTKMKDLLPRLREQGVDVVISYGVEDKTTPGERIQEAVEAEDVAGLYSARGGHSSIYWAPKKFAHLIDHTFSSLEKRH